MFRHEHEPIQRTGTVMEWVGRKLLCWGGGWHGIPFAQPPPSLLGRRAGRGFGPGLPYLPCRGGGGPTPTYMAQNDPHVTLII